ncbi:MAG: aminotransferase class I/II-fold pyridoxal phosphate-dependent enzyme, partial [Propionibacteriaceae bacterium]|nr:aminotransferase class I/II-fold pyridoxal phosphate-dependent enzyme [Propionibacteriaceae bacterium]
GAGDEVVYAWRSFEAYPQLVIGAGARPVTVPLTSASVHDLAGLAAAVTDRTGCVVICNPNNPTGTVVTAAALEALMAQVPPTVTVILDEAYWQFDDDPASPVGIDFYRRYPNLVVCHTFSKAYGLAGLRVGYAIAPAALAEQVRKLTVPFGVTNLAQRAALASLEVQTELDQRVADLISRRQQVTSALAAQGWAIPVSRANFIWLPTGRRTAEVAAQLDQQGLTSRVFAGEGIRTSIGEEAAMETFVRLCGQLIDQFPELSQRS